MMNSSSHPRKFSLYPVTIFKHEREENKPARSSTHFTSSSPVFSIPTNGQREAKTDMAMQTDGQSGTYKDLQLLLHFHTAPFWDRLKCYIGQRLPSVGYLCIPGMHMHTTPFLTLTHLSFPHYLDAPKYHSSSSLQKPNYDFIFPDHHSECSDLYRKHNVLKQKIKKK